MANKWQKTGQLSELNILALVDVLIPSKIESSMFKILQTAQLDFEQFRWAIRQKTYIEDLDVGALVNSSEESYVV